jgi:hypothetical protein
MQKLACEDSKEKAKKASKRPDNELNFSYKLAVPPWFKAE